jgi:hypothetical protein
MVAEVPKGPLRDKQQLDVAAKLGFLMGIVIPLGYFFILSLLGGRL